MAKIEPIRNPKKLQQIKHLLRGEERWRDYSLFVLGIHFALRIEDLLGLTAGDVLDNGGNIKDSFSIVEQKTGKENVIKINDSAKETLELLDEEKYLLHDRSNHLIWNTRGGGKKKLSRTMAYYIMKKIAKQVGLKNVNIGTHSLRKTWGYHAHKQGVSIEIIQAKFMHESTSTTREYLGLGQKDVSEAYDKVSDVF